MDVPEIKAGHDPAGRDRILGAVRGALAGIEGILWAYVFGSLARGEAFADVDVAVFMDRSASPSLRSLGHIARMVEKAIGMEGIEVDCVDVRSCALPMVDEILSQGLVVLDRVPPERRVWEGEITIRWLDFQPFWEEQAALRARKR